MKKNINGGIKMKEQELEKVMNKLEKRGFKKEIGLTMGFYL